MTEKELKKIQERAKSTKLTTLGGKERQDTEVKEPTSGQKELISEIKKSAQKKVLYIVEGNDGEQRVTG